MWNLFASINVPGLLLQEGDQVALRDHFEEGLICKIIFCMFVCLCVVTGQFQVRDASSFSKLLGQVEVLSVDPQVFLKT